MSNSGENIGGASVKLQRCEDRFGYHFGKCLRKPLQPSGTMFCMLPLTDETGREYAGRMERPVLLVPDPPMADKISAGPIGWVGGLTEKNPFIPEPRVEVPEMAKEKPVLQRWDGLNVPNQVWNEQAKKHGYSLQPCAWKFGYHYGECIPPPHARVGCCIPFAPAADVDAHLKEKMKMPERPLAEQVQESIKEAPQRVRFTEGTISADDIAPGESAIPKERSCPSVRRQGSLIAELQSTVNLIRPVPENITLRRVLQEVEARMISKGFSEDSTYNPADDRKPAPPQDFGFALRVLKNGGKVCRSGWNGRGMWIQFQRPDANSKMSLPYLYIEYPEGHPAYPNGSRVPWMASQTDMLACDWEVV